MHLQQATFDKVVAKRAISPLSHDIFNTISHKFANMFSNSTAAGLLHVEMIKSVLDDWPRDKKCVLAVKRPADVQIYLLEYQKVCLSCAVVFV